MDRGIRTSSNNCLPYDCRFEIGPWFDGGKPVGPDEIQSRICNRDRDPNFRIQASCIYIHVPFCPTRCSYCALYTRAVTHHADTVLDEFTDVLSLAIRRHPYAHSKLAPTTIHFGGGTPLFLGIRRFSRIADVLRETFEDSSECEWAVETTTSAMDHSTTAALKNLGVRRIHLGVQTLSDPIRQQIRRREPAESVLEKIRFLIDQNFLISVDLILGFEKQTVELVEEDLTRLHEAGVRMFSICELRNLRGGRNTPEIAVRNHRLWCSLWRFMKSYKLIPIHTGQFGRNAMDNLYYTHPARGEDCIAIGPYAHGSSGNLMYANMLLPQYYYAVRKNNLPVQFGVVIDGCKVLIQQMEKELLGHRIHPSLVQKLRDASEQFCLLWDEWVEKELLSYSEKRKCFQPSCNGSWFVGNMALELRGLTKSGDWKQ